NLGARFLSDIESIGEKKARAGVEEAVREHFKPEFLNRLTAQVIFNSLTKADLLKVVDIQIEHFTKLLAAKHIHLHLTKKAREYLGGVGFDPVFGARPLKRAIEKHLSDPLAREVLSENFTEGAKIEVDAASNGEGLTFHQAK
ncbi:MAG TPA: type VI secretion system ATPase TssH, partial [Planctomycetota bacterium]|nr:type VI secretion system ATPase TssH [Planctomycetota bacterium]